MTVLFWILIVLGVMSVLYGLFLVKPAWKVIQSENVVDDLAEAMPVLVLFWIVVIAAVCFAGAGLIAYYY